MGLGMMLGGLATGLEHQQKLGLEQEKADAESELKKAQAKKALKEDAEKNYKDLKEGYEGLVKQMVGKIEAEAVQPGDQRFQAMTQFVPMAIKRIAEARTAAFGGEFKDNLTTVGDQVLGHLGAAKDKNMTAFADAAAESINKATKADLRTGYSEGVTKAQTSAGEAKTEAAMGVPEQQGANKGTAAVAAAPGMGKAEALTAASGGASADAQRQLARTQNTPIVIPEKGSAVLLGGGNAVPGAGLGTGTLMPPVTAAPRAPVSAAPLPVPASVDMPPRPALGGALTPPAAPVPVPAPPVGLPAAAAVPPGAVGPAPAVVPPAAAVPVPVPAAGPPAGAPRPGMSTTETFPNGAPMPQAPVARRLPGGGTAISQPASAPDDQAKMIEKYFGEKFVDIQKRADSSQDRLQSLSRLDHVLDQVNTNKFTGTTTNLKAMAKAAGIDLNAIGITDDVGASQAAQAAAREMALQLRNPAGGAGMPGAMSDADRNYLESMIPGVEMTREGRKLVIENFRKVAQRDAEVAHFAAQYASQRGGGLDFAFSQALRDQFGAAPVFNDADRQRLQLATPVPVPGASDANPAGDPTKRMDGQVYMTPAGPKKWTAHGWDN